MVWGRISKAGRLSLIFIDKVAKVNTDFYMNHVLKAVFVPGAEELFGDSHWFFQQDFAPAHKAIKTQKFCADAFPGFISSNEWPASSPDLNLSDFSIWGYMLKQLKVKNGLTVENFKRQLTKILNEIPEEYVSKACDSFIGRCQCVIDACGERIEMR